MNIRKIVRKRIRSGGKRGQVAADVNATIAANVNEPGSRSHVSTRQRSRIIQRSGRQTDENATDEGR